MLKKIVRGILIAVGSVIALFLLLAVALYIPPVQRFAVRQATHYIYDKTGIQARIGSVRLAFPLDLALIDVFAQQRADTIIDARSLRANVALLPLLKGRIDVDGLEIYHAKVNTLGLISDTQIKGSLRALKVESRGIDLGQKLITVDLAELRGADIAVLLSDTAKEDTTPTEPSLWKIDVKKVNIENTAVSLRMPGDSMRIAARVSSLTASGGYVDTNTGKCRVARIRIKDTDASYDIPYAARERTGIDANHIAATGLNASIDSLDVADGAVAARVNSLSVSERSGLSVDGLSGRLFANSDRVELSGFHVRTPYSTLQATGILSFGALRQGGKGQVKMRVSGDIDRRDILAAVPGGLPKSVTSLLPAQPIGIAATLSGSRGDITVDNGAVSIRGMARLKLAGRLHNITEDSRSGHLRYSLATGNVSPLMKALGLADAGISIPRGTSAAGTLSFTPSTYSTNSLLRTGGGTARIIGKFTPASEAYRVRLDARRLPLGKIITGSGLHSLTGRATAEGRGFDPFARSMRLSAKAALARFGISDYDLSSTSLTARMSGGTARVAFHTNNSLIAGNGKIAAQFTRNSLRGSLSALLSQLDVQKITSGEKPLKISTRVATKFYASRGMTRYGVNAIVDSIIFHADSGKTFRAKDLFVKLDNSRDSLYAKVSAGDLFLTAHGGSDISRTASRAGLLATMLGKQIKRRSLDLEALRHAMPSLTLTADAGSDNPLSNFLRYRQGYTFRRLLLNMHSSAAYGLTADGYVSSFDTGSLLLDSVGLKLRQDTAGLRLSALVSNTSKGNPYIFTAKLNGTLRDNGAAADVTYTDKLGHEGMNLGLQAMLTDSGATMHIYPTNPVIAYRKFKVNADNFVTIGDDKAILANVDLLADDGTGLKIYGDRNDSVSDITASVNRLNLAELTSSLPFMPAISGFLSGDFHVIRGSDNVTAAYDISVAGMAYEGSPLGNVGLVGTYMPIPKMDAHYINSTITGEGEDVASVDGTYYGRTDSLDATLALLRFPTAMLNGFTGETLSLGGHLDGSLALTGTTSRPVLDGKVMLDSVRVYSDIYGFDMLVGNDSARVEQSVLYLDTLNFYSAGNEPMTADGNINLSDLGNVNMNINVKAHNFKLINSQQTAKSEVYGTVYSDIDASVRGSLDNLFVFGRLGVLPKTDVTYVMKDSPLAAENDLNSLVTFTDFSDTAAVAEKEETSTGLTMILRVSVDDAAHLHCDINDDNQSYIDVEGGGNLTLKYNPDGEMVLTGRYTIGSGEMKYTLPVIPLRTFYLTDGSYIEFTGEPMNPTLNIAATERVKASVNEGDNPRTVSFDVGLKLTQPLNRMGLEFTIEAVDDQSIQNQLASMSAEQRNKLAISMLATGLYLEESNASGGLKTSNALNAFLQNQVQQIAGKALKSVDLSLSVDDGTSVTGESNTDYSFRFSKKFWGDRVNVIIGGHVSTGEDAHNDASSFIDNVSLEYRLDNNAKRYVRLFYDRESNDPFEGNLIEAGAGLVLRRKLDRFSDIFLLRGKAKKRAQKASAAADDKHAGGEKKQEK